MALKAVELQHAHCTEILQASSKRESLFNFRFRALCTSCSKHYSPRLANEQRDALSNISNKQFSFILNISSMLVQLVPQFTFSQKRWSCSQRLRSHALRAFLIKPRARTALKQISASGYKQLTGTMSAERAAVCRRQTFSVHCAPIEWLVALGRVSCVVITLFSGKHER